ncbi:MAG: YggT family protein [bacterium]
MTETILNLAAVTGWALKIYSWMHIAAFVLSWINADPNNAIVSLINRSTMPLWQWIGQKLPRQFVPFAPIFALMLVIFGEITLPGLIRSVGATVVGAIGIEAALKNIIFYLIYGGLYIVSNIIGFIFFLAIIWFVFTLVNPPLNNPIIRSIMFLIDPLITPLQRILPRTRIDLSPLVLALIAFFLREVVSRLMIPLQTGLVV